MNIQLQKPMASIALIPATFGLLFSVMSILCIPSKPPEGITVFSNLSWNFGISWSIIGALGYLGMIISLFKLEENPNNKFFASLYLILVAGAFASLLWLIPTAIEYRILCIGCIGSWTMTTLLFITLPILFSWEKV